MDRTAGIIAGIHKDLAQAGCPGEKRNIRVCALEISDAGFTNLQEFMCGKKALGPEMVRTKAVVKAFLRGLLKKAHGEGVAVKASSTPSKTASAEEVVMLIRLAKATKVVRPCEGPMKTISSLVHQNKSDSEMEHYVQLARLEAVCGNMASIMETATALKCWSMFALGARLVRPGEELPPTVTGLLAWSRQFAVKGTFNNYLGKLALACEIGGVSRESFSHESIARAKRTIGSLSACPKPKMAIRMAVLEKLISLATIEGDPQSVLLYLISYCFMLRVPSEALPLEVGARNSALMALGPGRHSCLALCGETMVLRLARRKNKPHGTVLTRKCWCSSSTLTCPVHAVGQIISSMPSNLKVFEGLSAQAVRYTLRDRVRKLGLCDSQNYNTHDFRRGHARDLANSKGSTIKQILEMGQWKSSAILKYVDQDELETQAVVEAHICESDDSDVE